MLNEVPVNLQHLVTCSVEADNPLEDITYPVITAFLLLHQIPSDRFIIYPQITLRWNPSQPQDKRSEVPDLALVNFRRRKPLIFRLGVESKAALIPLMRKLPIPATIEGDNNVMVRLQSVFFQAEDQSKAAIRNNYLENRELDYLLFIGPYWTHVTVGPFSEAQLTVRTHKQSDSGDFTEVIAARVNFKKNPIRRKLFLLGTRESMIKMEEIIATTDCYAENAIAEGRKFHRWDEQQTISIL